MKKINILIGTAILSAAFISCRNEAIVDNTITTPNGIQTLHCTLGSYNAPQSRAQVEIGYGEPDKEIFMWNSQDAFTVYDHTDIEANATTSYQFTIANYNEEEPSATADFLGEGELPDGHAITAIYPTQKTAVNAGTITLTIPEFSAATMQANTPEEQTAYMSERMFMFATGTVATENNNLAFEQLCAMARITYVNATPDEQTVTNVALRGDGEYFGESMEFNLLEQEGSTPKTSVSTSLKFTNLTIPAGNSAEFYLLFFPGKSFNTNGTLTICMNIGNQEYEVTMPTSDIAGNNNGTNGFESSKRYWFNLIQTPDEGLIWKKNMATGIIYNLPLIQAIEDTNGIQFTKNENGYVDVEVNKEKIAQVTFYHQWGATNLTYLDGLEYFINLENLTLSDMNLKSINVTKNVNLKTLYCCGNELTKLDVSQNTKLEVLECYDNRLTNLDISKNTLLKTLNCQDNKLTELNLQNNTALEVLYCGRNLLTDLNISSNIALMELSCRENEFQTINLKSNTELFRIDCFHCSLPTLDVSNNTKLTELYCGGNKITNLDVSKNTQLKIFRPSGGYQEWYGSSEISENLFTSIDLSNNSELEELDIDNCQFLETLNISNNTKLKSLRCGSTKITSLDLSKNTELTYLDCGNAHNLTSLNVSLNTKLERLTCCWTDIQELDVSKNTALTELVCSNEKLTSIDLSNNSELVRFECTSSPITSLNLSKQTKLKELYCYYCRLTALDITNNLLLEEIRVGNQQDENWNSIELTLTLTSAQNEQFSDMLLGYNNEHITTHVQD